MDSMFDILANIPLFRGVTRDRIAATVGMAKFHFIKYAPGEVVAEAGEPCTQIKFILSGSIRMTIANGDDRLRVSQTLAGPDVISPDFLFGTSTFYPGRAVAIDDVGIVQVSKNDYMKILASDSIYLYNYLNYLSMNAQKCVDGILAISSGSIEERLAMWVVAMTQPTARDIDIVCKQRDMYAMMGVQRSSFMAALENMAQKGLISVEPGIIHVLDRRAMLAMMRNALE